MTRNITLAILPLLMLASCGTPQEQCIDRNTSEYRTVQRLLAEVEGNIARGYAWGERTVPSTEWDDCPSYIRNKKGDVGIVYRPCLRNTVDTVRYRVPIDPASETRKRDNLQARLSQLTPATKSAVNACKAAYPEDRKS